MDKNQLLNLLIPKYPKDKVIEIGTTDPRLLGFNEGWNAFRTALYDNLPAVLDFLDKKEEKYDNRKSSSKS